MTLKINDCKTKWIEGKRTILVTTSTVLDKNEWKKSLKPFPSIILPSLKALVSSVGSFLCRRPRVARPGLWARVWTSMRHGVPPCLRLLPRSPWANLLLPGPADPSMLHATCYTKHAGRLLYSVVDTTHQTLVSRPRVRLWGERTVAYNNTNPTPPGTWNYQRDVVHAK